MRIMIYGRPGSGKSTCALALSKKLGLPLHHLDKHFFVENWIKRDYNEFLEIQKNIVDTGSWIIDGCSLQSIEMRYARADICIFMIYPRWLCLWRLFKRMFCKNSAIDDRAPGCNESISWDLIKYTWTFEYRLNGRLYQQLTEMKQKYPLVKFYRVASDSDLKAAIEQIGAIAGQTKIL